MLYQCLIMLMDAEYGTGVDENGIGSWGALLLGFVFITAVLGFLIYRIIKERLVCTVPVQAVCVDMQESRSEDGTTYAPLWEYEFQGRIIQSPSNLYSSSTKSLIGTTRVLYINPDAPEEFRQDLKTNLFGLVICGILFVVIVGAMLVKAGMGGN